MAITGSRPSPPPAIAAASRRRSFPTAELASRLWRKKGLKGVSRGGAKVHRLLVWKTYDSGAQSHQPDLSTLLAHNLLASRLASRPRRRAGEEVARQRHLVPPSPGAQGSDGGEHRNWVNIHGPAPASPPPPCQMLLIYSVRDTDQVYL